MGSLLREVLICCAVTVVLVAGVKTQSSEGSTPEGCISTQQQLVCTNLTHTVWVDFLRLLPQDTRSLTIKFSIFPSLNIPDGANVPTFKHLKYLRMTHCNITVVGSKAFQPFPDLVELHLDSDSIRELGADALHSLSSLTLLNLTRNVIESIHQDTFQATSDLRILDLAYNRIQILYPQVFRPTDQLRQLNLTKNRVTYVHPDTFQNLTNLHTLDLKHNQLEVLHHNTFENLTSLRHVSIDNNPWSCDCGLRWLHPSSNQTHPLLRSINTDIRCTSPQRLKSVSLSAVSADEMTCTSPQILNDLTDTTILRLNTRVLPCNATGYPAPSVYWITPRGVLAVPSNRRWMSPDIVHFSESHEYVGVPTFHKSNLVALEDGSLRIHQIRHYFAGRYTCVAENPAGISTSSFNVSILSAVQFNTHFSMVIGGFTALTFLVCSTIILGIRQCMYTLLKKRYVKALPVSIEEEESMYDDEDYSPKSAHSGWYPDYFSREYISPYESPMKCTTPVEADLSNGRTNIRETLEDVRWRLRVGMERSVTRIRSGAHSSVTKIRSGAQHVTASSRHYMQNIRESGSNTIHSLRSSGSQYANRVRAGMVLGVEQVKYHVQSMRELCLTGNIGQTISTISVATNVDSQEKSDVVKKITYV